jgi:hypothetical protein
MGSVTTAAPTYTTATVNSLSLDTGGGLRVSSTIVDAANNSTVTTSPVPIGGVYESSPTTLTAGQVGYPLLDTDHRLSENVGKINGVTPLMGNGATGTGALRVSIANDSTGIVALTTGSAQIGHLEANQSENVAQMNGVAVTMGNGASGTGVQRVTLASDSTGVVTLTSPLPASGIYVPAVTTSAMTGTTSTAVVAAVASNYLYITQCSFSNDHASTSTLMKLQDGSGGTTLWEGMVPFGGGSNVTWPVPLKVPTIGNGLYVANVTTSSSTYASCSGFKSTVSF